MRKKRVLIHSNYCGAKTGFGGFAREILTYLYELDKYDLYLYAAGTPWNHPDYSRWPWKVIGTLPNDRRELEALSRDPNMARAVSYGGYLIDKAIQEVRPDVYIGIEDPWGVAYCKDKSWWNKIGCVIHSTIDSRPILPAAVDLAKQTTHFYSWADFATKDFHKLGLSHVKTIRGSVNNRAYRRLDKNIRQELRMQHNIPQDAFCVGMLGRNQLRKSFPTLIEGYQMFKDKNPDIKNTRLLFFTHFGEGWNIIDRCKEYGVNPEEVLACYKCRATGNYFVMPFQGQDIDNPVSGHQKSMITVNVQDGLTEEQVNEWYNLLDVYAHPFTSGGQERPIQEAKLTELITLVTNYSCGEDSCVPEAASLPLDYEPYRENGTEFIKAATKAYSIAKNLLKVYNMKPEKRLEMGRQAKKWVMENFSIEVIGKQYEEIIDSFDLTNYDFVIDYQPKNVNAVIPDSGDNKTWVKSLYKLILGLDVVDADEGLQHWLTRLEQNTPRPAIEQFFREEGARENAKHQKGIDLATLLGPESPKERVLINMPESIGDCILLTSLLQDAREQYPDKKIYVATKPPFKPIFEPLIGRFIDYVIEWNEEFDNSMKMEGYGKNEGYFRIVLQPHFGTQRMINYLHHGEDKSRINLHMPRIIYHQDKIFTSDSPAR